MTVDGSRPLLDEAAYGLSRGRLIRGTSVETPRWSSTRTIPTRSMSAAIILIRPPHPGHASASTPHTRHTRRAQSMRELRLVSPPPPSPPCGSPPGLPPFTSPGAEGLRRRAATGPHGDDLLPTDAERADTERAAKEVERIAKEAALARAVAESARADAAEVELARLRADAQRRRGR